MRTLIIYPESQVRRTFRSQVWLSQFLIIPREFAKKSHESRQSRASKRWRKVEHLTVSVGTWRQMLRKMRRTPSILPLVTLGHGRLLMSEYIRGCSTITVLRSSVSQLHLLVTATVTYYVPTHSLVISTFQQSPRSMIYFHYESSIRPTFGNRIYFLCCYLIIKN